jgi:hypothetical protein
MVPWILIGSILAALAIPLPMDEADLGGIKRVSYSDFHKTLSKGMVSEVQFASDKDCVFKLRQDDDNEADNGQIYRTQVQETPEALSIRSEHSLYTRLHTDREGHACDLLLTCRPLLIEALTPMPLQIVDAPPRLVDLMIKTDTKFSTLDMGGVRVYPEPVGAAHPELTRVPEPVCLS